jgi:hypothetical protein
MPRLENQQSYRQLPPFIISMTDKAIEIRALAPNTPVRTTGKPS